MKIAGVDPKTLPTEEVLVLPRGEQQIVFKARGLSDWSQFNKLVPEPTPPGKLTRDGYVPDTDDPGYTAVLGEYVKRKYGYLVIRSLEPSDIEWETVSLDNPSTWVNWESDLRNAGLLATEVNKVFQLVFDANCLNEKKLEKARELFLRGPQPGSAASLSPSIAPGTSPSGVPVAE